MFVSRPKVGSGTLVGILGCKEGHPNHEIECGKFLLLFVIRNLFHAPVQLVHGNETELCFGVVVLVVIRTIVPVQLAKQFDQSWREVICVWCRRGFYCTVN